MYGTKTIPTPPQVAGGIHRIRVTGVNHEEKFTNDGLDEAIRSLLERLDGYLWDHFTMVDHEAVFANFDGKAEPARIFTFEVHPDTEALYKTNLEGIREQIAQEEGR